MKKTTKIFSALIILGLFTNCSKVVDGVLEEATPLTSSDFITEAKIDNTIDDVSNLVQEQYATQIIETKKTTQALANAKPTTTWSISTTTNTITRTIDYGTGYNLNNGNKVTGKIIMTFLKDFDLSNGVARTINYSLENFTHNGNTITGSKNLTISKKSTDILTAVHTVITHTIDTKITFLADGKTFTRIGTLTGEVTKGDDSPLILTDNEYTITGKTSTTLPNNATITNTITKPLIAKGSCDKNYPLQGSVTTTKNNFNAVIDFGDGTCDDQATFTFRGITLPFTIQKP